MFLPIKIHQRLEWLGTDRPDLSGVGGAVLIVLIDVTGRTNRNVYTTPASPLTPATSSSSSKCGAWRGGGRGRLHQAVRTPGTKIILKCDITMYTSSNQFVVNLCHF